MTEPHIPTPEEFAELPRPEHPPLTPLGILTLAQLFRDEPEAALKLAQSEGDRHDRERRS